MIDRTSPCFTIFFFNKYSSDRAIIWSVLSGKFNTCGETPQKRFILLQISSRAVNPVIEAAGLNFETSSAVKPLLLNATMVLAPISSDDTQAASAMASGKFLETNSGEKGEALFLSVYRIILSIMCTV